MKQTHLPKDPTSRGEIIKQLDGHLKLAQADHSKANSQLIKQAIRLRIKLIGDCTQLSVQRIEHLQQIFKHYCTHIFKIGKHMTFERLQYQKVHLTLDRLCVFLKDFGLTTAKIDQQEFEIIEKQQVVRNFKRMSKNCRDLSFQQFIACLQKLAIVYYDQKQIYKQKKDQQNEQRKIRIQQYKIKMKEKKRQEEERKRLQQQQQQSKMNLKEQNNYDAEDENGEKNQNGDQEGHAEEENDDIVKNLMENSQLENPNDEINKALGKNQKQQDNGNQFGSSQVKTNKKTKKQFTFTYKSLPDYCKLTIEQKIQYFYQIINVDNVSDFRKKMSQLGLPLFKQYNSHSQQSNIKQASSGLLNVTVENNENQQQRRLIQLRQKLSIKKERDKHQYSPTLTKQEYEQRKKRRQEKQAKLMSQLNSGKVNQQTVNDKQRQKKKIELMDKQLSLDMLNNIAFDDLKNKFDPKKFVFSDQTDEIFLNEYGYDINSKNVEPKANKQNIKSAIRQKTSSMLERKRTSSNIVEDFKKRAYEMQVKQFHKEAKLSKFVDQMKKKQKWRNQII